MYANIINILSGFDSKYNNNRLKYIYRRLRTSEFLFYQF